jgi:GNAT superfamily N-acetyltransferase
MPSASEVGADSAWWQCLAVDAERTPVWFAVVGSGRHPAGTRVELLSEAADREVGDDAACVASFDPGGEVAGLRLGPRSAPPGLAVWFAEYRETNSAPPAVSLMAFTGHGLAGGSLIGRPELAELPIGKSDQLGAVRWYPATGEVDQIYVHPDFRRRRLGSGLVAAAAALSYARGWPRLWSDGQRTELGERFRNASPWRQRTAQLTHVVRPMTPGEA